MNLKECSDGYRDFSLSENGFYSILWTGFFICIISIFASISGYYDSKNEKISELIREGHNPIAVKCAMDDEYGRHPSCVILATNGIESPVIGVK